MRSKSLFIAFNILTALILAFSAVDIMPVYAASIIMVDTTDSQVGNDDVCALHEAVINANNDAQTHTDCAAGSGADTIVFADSLGTATVTYLEGGGSVTDADGLTIDGGGDITVSGANFYQVFVVSSGASLTLQNITITNGVTMGSGGGVNNAGALTIINSAFSNNRATTGSGFGGAIYNSGTAIISAASFTGNIATFYEGGAIYNEGSGVLTVSSSSFSGNGSLSVPAGAIGNHGTAIISASTFSGNTSSTGSAIYNMDGTLTVINSTITENSAVLGGGIYSTQSGGTASLTVINSTIANNTGGGGVVNGGGGFRLTNTIVANNAGGNCSGTITNGGNNIDDGTSCSWGSASNSKSSTDPQLGTLTGSPAYYPLDATSPAINMGDNTTCAAAPVNNESQNGVTRPSGLYCDIGAYEFTSVAQTGPTFVVNTNADTNDNSCDTLGSGIGNQDCTLREAMNAANAISGADTITFSVSGTITLGSALPAIADDLTIDGAGQKIIVSGNNAMRVMYVNENKTLTLQNLTVADGASSGGAGILNYKGTLNVINVLISNNNASGVNVLGGGILNYYGTLNVFNSSLANNSAAYGGGIENSYGVATIVNSTFYGNRATSGGAIYSLAGGVVTFKNTIIASSSGDNCINYGTFTNGGNNIDDGTTCGWGSVNGSLSSTDPKLDALADNGGPTQTMALLLGSPAVNAGDAATCADSATVNGIDQRGVTRPQGAACDIGAFESEAQTGPNFTVNTNVDTDDGYCDILGQGLDNQDCTLREAINAANTLSGANAITFAGDYTITLASQLPDVTTEMTITGNGAVNTVVQASAIFNTATYRVFNVTSSGNLTLDGLTVQNGCNSTCVGGGGIYNSGALTVSNVIFNANYATYGGGMGNSNNNPTLTNVTFSGNSAANGGGMYNSNSNPTLTNVTFSGNSAANGGGMNNAANSGPVLANVTFSGNSATNGGGMYNDGSHPTLANVTFSGNSATTNGGGLYNYFSSSPILKNVIIANSVSGGDCVNSPSSSLGAASTNNLIADSANACGLTNGANGNVVGQDPKLGALADNGGPTQTFALLAGSPAINAGDNATCADADTVNNLDQRGVTRPQGAACDIGAYEYEISTILTTSVEQAATQADPTSNTPIRFTVTFSKTTNASTFTSTDIILGGTSGATTKSILEAAPYDGTTFTVFVSGMTKMGAVTISIPANAAQDIFGYFNQASVSLDNVVNYIHPTYAAVSLVSPANGALIQNYAPKLDWSNATVPAGVTFFHYQIEVATDSAFVNIVHNGSTVGTAATSFYSLPTNLSPNTRYYWRVRWVSGQGAPSKWSAVRSLRAAMLPPTLNTPTDIPTLDHKRPTFDWDSVDGATSYTIQLARANTFATITKTYTSYVNQYTPSADLPGNVRYYWRVRANGANGPSAWSAPLSFKTGNPPSIPILSSPANRALVNPAAQLFDWANSTLPSGVTFDHYEMEIARDAAFTDMFQTANVTDIANSQFTSNPLATGTTYYWRVRSVGTYSAVKQYSSWSLVRTVKAKFSAPILLFPANTLTPAVGDTTPTFMWNPVNGATGYTIQIARNATFTTGLISVNVAGTAYTPTTPLLSGVTYYWRVRVNGIYAPIFSAKWSFKP